MQDVSSTLSVGMLIRDRYQVKRLSGKSQTGAVYLVVDQRANGPDRQVLALQEIIGLNEQERYQIIFDSIVLSNIHHEAVPSIYHVFNDDIRHRVCIVMDYVEGPDLDDIRQMHPEQRMSWPEVAEIMAPIVDAVSYLHCQEPPIVHGDIKPANILCEQNEEKFMLIGIGVAREQHSAANVSITIAGNTTLAQSGEVLDGRTDIYGFGATCYTMLTGTVPPNVSIRAMHLEQTQTDLLKPANVVVPTVPSHVALAIHRAMSLHPEERFFSIEEFWQALQTPLKERQPQVDLSLLPTTPSTSVVTEQIQVLTNVQKHDISRRKISTGVHFFLLKGRAVPLLLLILILLFGGGASTWLLVQSHHAPSISEKHVVTPSSVLATPVTSTAPIVTPTSSPGNYPGLVGSYAGTLADIPANASATIIIQGVHQIGGTINGYFTVGSPLGISGPFSGTIDFTKRFQFTVNDAAGHPLFFVEGAIQSATGISGDFYQCTSASSQEGKCSRASDGYGIWSALLATSGR